MAFWQRIDRPVAMASRWRRRQVCELRADGGVQMVALSDVSGHGALIETRHPPALGVEVELRHPVAGTIIGRVSEMGENRIRIRLDGTVGAVAFALGAIAADMTRD